MEATETHDEMTTAFSEQLSDDLAKKAEAASQSFVWDEGYYLAQYKKHTTFHSDIAEFTGKTGDNVGKTFPNPFYNVPVSAMVFDLLGFAGRKGDAIVEWEKPKGYSFKACFRDIRKFDRLSDESTNGGLMQACAAGNGFAGKTTDELIDWFHNHLVVIHVGKMKAATGKNGQEYPARNVVRSIKPHNG
jgi:hypothetical protein